METNPNNYIDTFTKIKFSPLNPTIQDTNIIDIAHALSLICRFNGHCSYFYSVAQHSIFCAEEARLRGHSEKIQLACLLHDAEEAYVSDITRPVKKHLPEFIAISNKVQDVIWKHFGLDDLKAEDFEIVKDIDDTLLGYEGLVLMGPHFKKSARSVSKEYNLAYRDMISVRDEFIERAKILCGKLNLNVASF
ncbi:hypothetical protein [Paenibacillus humicus]|uniref:hypothetical protein n=1 Tax=Paenibacillus humicus TaxID=412861 RepID=UPI003D27A01B